VRIPASVEEIQEVSFHSCIHMREITFEPGSKLKRVREYALAYTGILHLTIPSNVEFIERGGFRGNARLRSLDFEPVSTLRHIEALSLCV
jgi:hypothetical protein